MGREQDTERVKLRYHMVFTLQCISSTPIAMSNDGGFSLIRTEPFKILQ